MSADEMRDDYDFSQGVKGKYLAISESKVMTDKPKLLPCPFCGSTAIASGWTRVQCYGCGAWIENSEADYLAHAAWNRRTTAKPVAAQDGPIQRVEQLIKDVTINDRYGRPLIAVLQVCAELATALYDKDAEHDPKT
jgi:hypothetical protein